MGRLYNQLRRSRDEFDLHRSGLAGWIAGDARPGVLFFPSAAPEGASLLRAYRLAEALAGLGWRTGCVPAGLKLGGRARVVRSFRPDLLVFQQCRSALNDAAHAFGIPFVLDTDDADFYLPVPGLPERLDRTSRAAAGVMAGSRFLRDWHVERNPRTEIVWTGTPISQGARPAHRSRLSDGLPILAWAQAKPLDYARELDFVLELAARLQQRAAAGTGPAFRLRFYGVSTAEEAQMLHARVAPGIVLDLVAPLDYDAFLQSLRDVAVGLSPVMVSTPFSRGKSFGKILGYLDAQVPVIASDEADHALFFNAGTGIISNDPSVWEEGAVRLLADPEARDAMAKAAFEGFQQQLSLAAAAAKTDRFLRDVLRGPV